MWEIRPGRRLRQADGQLCEKLGYWLLIEGGSPACPTPSGSDVSGPN